MMSCATRWSMFAAGSLCAVAVGLSGQGAAVTAAPPGADGRDLTPVAAAVIDAAVKKSLPLLQASARTWSERRSCTSCHHQSLGAMTVEVARERGFEIDPVAAHDQAVFTEKARQEGASVDAYVRGQGLVGAGNMGLAYSLMGLTAVGRPATGGSDVLAHFIAGRQLPDGRFPSPDHRPPHEDSQIAATAVAIRALRAYGRDAAETAVRVRRASVWLAGAQAIDTEDHAMQLLGLRWAGGRTPLIQRLQDAVLKRQRPDGGWSQIPTRSSDAYATGQILVALNQNGHSTRSEAYRRGVAFLVRNQLADGSWHVVTRRRNEDTRGQTYFETGFPHGPDQFISYAGSAWATMALCLTRSSGPSPALTDTTARPRSTRQADPAWTQGTTALMKAALLGSPADLKVLLTAGADPNVANGEGSTALMWAATRGIDSVELLLKSGAHPNGRDAQGFTALMLAAGHSGSPDVMRRLISAGADVNAVTSHPWAALRGAVRAGDLLKVRLLLDAGASLLVSRQNSNRMLFSAVTQDDTPMLQFLLDRGFNPDHEQNGYTGLMSAASHGLEGPLRLLLDRRANPNMVEARGGLTALMYAALKDPGHDRLVRALLTAGARPDTKSTEGLTALDYAVKYRHPHLAAALREAERSRN